MSEGIIRGNMVALVAVACCVGLPIIAVGPFSLANLLNRRRAKGFLGNGKKTSSPEKITGR